MNSYVLDASALLALLNEEVGAEVISTILPDAVISTVNLAEVVTRLALAGMPESAIRDTLALLPLDMVPFDDEQAFQTGLLAPSTRALGLSLGGRACLALARLRGATAVTADQAWQTLPLGVNVMAIR